MSRGRSTQGGPKAARRKRERIVAADPLVDPEPTRAEDAIAPQRIMCGWCEAGFNAYGWSASEPTTQATDCAASLWTRDGEWFIQGHYGSRQHDMTRYRFVKNHPTAPADPLCDACVTKRVEAGDLVVVGEAFL